ncbi:MAG: hypothetical protein ACLSDQ_07420 [Adlercreutzia equolifaciens]
MDAGAPDSRLTDQMPYYIPDDLGMEAAASDSGTHSVGATSVPSQPAMSPESIKVIDPAYALATSSTPLSSLPPCTRRPATSVATSAPHLQNNLTGCEIDPRAAQMASFALAMTACEWDSRFLRRADKVSANVVCCVRSRSTPKSWKRCSTASAGAARCHGPHGECGSLFVPSAEDIAALNCADDELDAREAGGDLRPTAPCRRHPDAR